MPITALPGTFDPCKSPSGGGTLLAQNALQPELGRANNVGHVPPDQAAATATATKALSPVPGVTSSCSAVNHLLKSVVREIRTLRSVGTGGGRPPPVTRCANETLRRNPVTKPVIISTRNHHRIFLGPTPWHPRLHSRRGWDRELSAGFHQLQNSAGCPNR